MRLPLWIHRVYSKLLLTIILIGGVVGGLSAALPAHADGVVGTGMPESCTETAFDSALSAGGYIMFNCGANPFTLALSTSKTINSTLTIAGSGQITLNASNHKNTVCDTLVAR
ncbi:MAG: hypothetical protein U0670_00495 [Anaerolineae bacterium]